MKLWNKKMPPGEIVVAVPVKLGDGLVLSVKSRQSAHAFYRAARKTLGLPYRTDELSHRTKRRLDQVVAMARTQSVTCVLIPVSEPTSEAFRLAKDYLVSQCPALEERVIDLGVNYILPAKKYNDVARYTAHENAVADWMVI